MADYVVDTNVLLVATRFQTGSAPVLMRRRGEDVPVSDEAIQEEVFLWLHDLRGDSLRFLVLDQPHSLIQGEYGNKLLRSEYGRMVVAEKLTKGQVRWVEVEVDDDGNALILHSHGAEVFDLADRKMVAAALESGATIINACDTDWMDLEAGGTLERLDVCVEHIVEPWCRAEWNRKKADRP